MLKKIVVFGFSLLILLACNTKFSVNGEYEEKPIVHFLLDQGQEYQFLKLNRTFLREGDAMEFAKDADLSYFDNVIATVEEIKNGVKIRDWVLKDTIITNKKEGVFYSPDQKLYFFKAGDLDEDAIYRLKIDIDNGNHIVTGQTELVKGVNITFPKPNQSFNFADNDVFANGYKSTPITFVPGNGAAYKVQVRFDYSEYTTTGQLDKSVLWNIGEVDNYGMTGQTTSMAAKGESFYEFLSRKVPSGSDVAKRTVRGMEILLTAGSSDLQTYILTNKPTSSLAQNKPVYSNVEGALGIFSARVTIKQYKPNYIPSPHSRSMNISSTKELCTGKYTVGLKFCSDIPEDSGSSYFCN